MQQSMDTPLVSLACADGDFEGGVKSVRIVPDGLVESKTGTFTLDGGAAAEMIAEFDKHGVELVIDFEHQTLGGGFAPPDGKAPAAGWITKIHYEKGRGVMGLVRWNPEARDLIRSGKYQYLSPVVWVRKTDGKAVELHSAAITNKPAIPRMEKLAASASERVAEGVKEGASEGMVGRIAAALGVSGLDTAATLEAILAKIKALTGEQQLASNVRTLLELPADATAGAVRAALSGMKSVSDKVGDLRVLAAKEFLGRFVSMGVLRPDSKYESDKKDYADFLELTIANRELAEKTLNQRIATWPMQGRTTDPGPAHDRDRFTVIHNARLTWDQEPKLQSLCDKVGYIGNALRDRGLDPLNETELKMIEPPTVNVCDPHGLRGRGQKT